MATKYAFRKTHGKCAKVITTWLSYTKYYYYSNCNKAEGNIPLNMIEECSVI